MSPVFRHGRLRLYLLKLLDEAPRHGYEVIRLLQDRFMGVYAPSPGTIYPRLARLEEEGLVTHDDVDGRKVYRITDKGRAEIQARLDDLADLEEEITESVRDIAREVTEDVRDTVRNLREELTWASREVRDSRDKAHHARGRRAAEGRRPAPARSGLVPTGSGLVPAGSGLAGSRATGAASLTGQAGPAGPGGRDGAAGRSRPGGRDGRASRRGPGARTPAWSGTSSEWRLTSPGNCGPPPGTPRPSARTPSPACG